jgi:23S rRNA pseudouridine2605 synthase
LKRGIHFAEGKFRVMEAYIVKVRGKSAIIELVLAEGHNRELRRLFARVGHKVMKLKRVAFGPIHLGNLPRGQHRELRRDELGALLAVIGRTDVSRAGDSRPAGKTATPRAPRAPRGRVHRERPGGAAGKPHRPASKPKRPRSR